jgi:hypothetical protein
MADATGVVGQVLNRDVIAALLAPLADEARQVAAGKLPRPAHGRNLAKSDLLAAADLLEVRTEGLAHTPVEAKQAARRRASVPPIDDYAFIPRDAVASVVQSALEELLREHGRVRQVRPQGDDGRRADDVPRVTDEYVDGIDEPPVDHHGEKRRFGGKFQIPSDPGWLSCKIAEGIRLWKKRHPFVDKPPTKKIGNCARLLLVGDWATGLPRARKVSNAMRVKLEEGLGAKRDVHVIHLGDVYYSGFGYEYKRRFLPHWPVWPEEASMVGSWSLLGNHDMYAGGWGYWNDLLSDPRFAAHDSASHFLLENDHWQIFGLDTAWKEEHGSLPGKQLEWLERERVARPKHTMLLSHHQLFSVYGDESEQLRDAILPTLRENPVDAWFWGHEHRCMVFSENDGVRYGCCLGHGGVPVYQWHEEDAEIPPPGVYEYRDVLPGLFGLEPWAVFGFAVVDLDDDSATVRYVNEVGYTHRDPEPIRAS